MKKILLSAVLLLGVTEMYAILRGTNTPIMRIDPTPYQEPESAFESAYWAALGIPVAPVPQAPQQPEAEEESSTIKQRIRPSFGG